MYFEVLLTLYKNNLQVLHKRAKEINVTDIEFKKILDESMKRIESEQCPTASNSRCCNLKVAFRIFFFVTVCCILTFVTLNVHRPTSSYVLRNVQGLIHPGLRFVRFLSMPIISKFPTITGLYDETCLIENPYFYVNDMDCWPCKNVQAVIDLTALSNLSLYKSGHPYMAKTIQRKISLNELKSVFATNIDIFNADLTTVKSNDVHINTVNNLINFIPKSVTSQQNTHIVIRINRMASARIIRQIFPRPAVVGEWSGQSIERFVIIDEPNSDGFRFPQFECSFVFVVQAHGERNIVLKPSNECGKHCKTVSILLKSSYVLWYNWWYWRPISLPKENSTAVSVTYINSFC